MPSNRPSITKRESVISRQAFPFEVVHINEPAHNMAAFHWHDFYEISFIEKGRGRYEIENKVFNVAAGDIVIINDIERHRVTYSATMPLYETVFHFTPRFVQPPDSLSAAAGYADLFGYEGACFANTPSLDKKSRAGIKAVVCDIKREYIERKPHFELMVRAKVLSLIAMLLRAVGPLRREGGELSAQRSNIRTLENIIQYIKKNFAEDVSLADAAGHFGYNTSYFSEYFKANIGLGFREYLGHVRIQEALKMLNEGRLSATRISMECGFNSVTSFYAAFRKITGTTPQNYLHIRRN